MNQSSSKKLTVLTLMHGVVDTYATLLPHILPQLLIQLGAVSGQNRLAGILMAAGNAFNSFSQLITARFADQIRSIHFLTLGVALPAIGISLLGLSPSLPWLISLLAIAGIGGAIFHPAATSQAGRLSGEKRGTGVSIFITGGNIGQAVGPFLIILFLEKLGLDIIWLTILVVPGLLVSVFGGLSLKSVVEEPIQSSSIKLPLWPEIRQQWFPLILLYLMSMLKTVTVIGFVTYLSLLLNKLGYSHTKRSLILAGFTFAGSMGILAGGKLSDILGGNLVLLISLAFSTPLLYLSASSISDSPIVFILLLFAGNFVLASSASVNIVMGQQLLPNHQSIASSFMMGAAWGLAGLFNIPLGGLADEIGQESILRGLSIIPFLTASLLSFLKMPKI
ncbi:MFS transporter [Candidatus Poribacteria bacterium]|nr:MFS transporter [Candidatus Poribacteria bacterium]